MLDLKTDYVIEQAKALFEDSQPQFGPAKRGRPKAKA